jgi:hypothetical protein
MNKQKDWLDEFHEAERQFPYIQMQLRDIGLSFRRIGNFQIGDELVHISDEIECLCLP